MRTSWTVKAPSNIAFMKYWGKRDPKTQWPANDSISMTLSNAYATTVAAKNDRPYDQFALGHEVINSAEVPQHKVFKHLHLLRQQTGTGAFLDIKSRNSFPASCGIASSASGFAALTLAATAAMLETDSWEEWMHKGISRSNLANLARQGSGSAGRSLFGGIVHWNAGTSAGEQSIAPIYDSNYWDLSDIIVVVSDDIKHVSSSQAHLAAWDSPFFAPRLAGLPERCERILKAIELKSLPALGQELEAEALEMHAVAMTGNPAVHYLLPHTCEFLAWLRLQRRLDKFPAWFTIDAGPNVHLICESKNAAAIETLVAKDWPMFKIIRDRIGSGPMIYRGDLFNES